MSLSQIKYSIYEDKSNTMHYLSVPMEKELLYYATSAGRECLRSDYFNERQDINIYMINYVLSGEGMLHVDGKEFRLKAGDLTFLHLSKHSIFYPETDGMEIVYFHVKGGQIQDIYNSFLEKQEDDYVLHGFPANAVIDCLEKFTRETSSTDAFYDRSCALYCLLTKILHVRRSEQVKKYPKKIDEILCWILYRCPPPSPAEVAEHFGFSPVYMERLFKRYVGQSMSSYILRQKYQFACRFLVDTDISVAEIARRVGYGDTKGLIVLFSKFGKLTPLAYRKRARGKSL